MIGAHTVQFILKFDFAILLYHCLKSYQFLKSHFPIDVNSDVAQKLSKNLAIFLKTFAALKCMHGIQ